MGGLRARTLCLAALSMLLSLLSAAPAAAADWVLAADVVQVRAGIPITLDVVYAGSGGATLPDTLRAHARAGDRVWSLELEALEPAQGMRRRYRVRLPEEARGSVVLDLVAHSSSKLVLIAAAPPPADIGIGTGIGAPAQEAAVAAPASDPVARLVEARPGSSDAAIGAGGPRLREPVLSAYEPMYFLVGTRQGTSARFQLSFKYRLFDNDSGWGRERPWLTGFYFAYTQNSFWDLSAQSRPFRDTSYKPSLFFQWQRDPVQGGAQPRPDALRAGLEHESNGKDGAASRSINTFFVQPVWRLKLPDERVLAFEPHFHAYLDKSDNPDIQKYRGYVDWRARLGREDGLIAAGNLRFGASGRGSMQLDLSYPARDELIGRIGGYWHVQYFNGYGEDILGYNQKRDAQIRFGFSIVR